MSKSKRDMCPLSHWSVVNVSKVWRQKDICMGKRTCVLLCIGVQDREIQTEIQTAQVNFIKVWRQKKYKPQKSDL